VLARPLGWPHEKLGGASPVPSRIAALLVSCQAYAPAMSRRGELLLLVVMVGFMSLGLWLLSTA
jgi:hypothetical protein